MFVDSEFNNTRRQTRKIFNEINSGLSDAGVLVKEGPLLGAMIIEAPSSTQNKPGERDPEMYQTKKGNPWHVGIKTQIGVDAKTGVTHSFTTAAVNEHDCNQAAHRLHGKEGFIFADSGYRSPEQREELNDVKAERQVKALKKRPRVNKEPLKTEYLTASIRAEVEHLFRIITCPFDFT